MKNQAEVRPSPIAGQWYPADPQQLASEVDGYLAAARLPQIKGEVVAVVAPHAGHRYSGPVAGYAFASLRGSTPEVVAVISPMHYPYHEPLITAAHKAYATPLGVIPIDQEALRLLNDNLLQSVGYRLAAVEEDPEHSLEIELPFLQRVLSEPFSLLPVMVRDQRHATIRALGDALASTLKNRKCLLVASTDLSHFYPREVAEVLDSRMLAAIESLNPQEVLDAEERGEAFACGRGAVAAVLWAAQSLGADCAQVLYYGTSGDITRDFTRVVGYGAAVITRTKGSIS